jgi:hypothetical protein
MHFLRIMANFSFIVCNNQRSLVDLLSRLLRRESVRRKSTIENMLRRRFDLMLLGALA